MHLSFRWLRPEHVADVEAWLNEVDTVRRNEALATLVDEGVSHESAHLIDTTDGTILVYAMETMDIEHARSVGAASDAEIDRLHKSIMRPADNGPVSARRVLDLRE